MNERQLRIFYEVALKLSMTEAAEKLYMSQPAISQTIKELESKFAVKLFDRIANKLYLTHQGEIFFSYSRRILNLYDECLNIITNTKNLKAGQLKVGASTTIGIYILADIIGKFKKLNKDIDISIVIENTRTLANFILENKIDFAFVEGPVYSEEIVIKEFCDDELVIIIPPEHPWVDLEHINIEEIIGQTIIMRERLSGARESFENLLNSHNIDLNVSIELGNTEAIKKAVEAGLGISCISKRTVEREVKDNRLAIVRLKDIKISRKFNLIYHKDKYISRLFDAFIDFFKQELILPK